MAVSQWCSFFASNWHISCSDQFKQQTTSNLWKMNFGNDPTQQWNANECDNDTNKMKVDKDDDKMTMNECNENDDDSETVTSMIC